jgi:hypothetical protein
MNNIKLSFLLFFQGLVYLYIILNFDGTGDSGDSIGHYLYAKYSFHNHDLFFHHWAKPLFVLLASPFAQFGFVGVKVFNASVMMLTSYFTVKTIQKLDIRNSFIGLITLLCSPLAFVLTFSGLTEPLFALLLILGVYLMISNFAIAACVVISFLPFVRSEGIIFIGVFGFYLLLIKRWKLIPLLIFGHVVYSIAGYSTYNDLLWVFNKIPYFKKNEAYGSGTAFHFIDQLNYVIGVPIYFLFWVGVISIVVNSIKRKLNLNILILVVGGIFAFITAHSIFWYFGLFNSLGLNRVLISITPLISIVSVIGFNFLTSSLIRIKSIRMAVQVLLIALIIIFPFTPNPAAIKWDSAFSLSEDQKILNQSQIFTKNQLDSNQRYFYSNPYIAVTLNLNPFDSTKVIDLKKENLKNFKKGDVIIWDHWFSVIEFGISKESLDSNKLLENIKIIQGKDQKIKFSIYKYK